MVSLTEIKAHLIPGFGLLQALSDLLVWNMRSSGIVSVSRSGLKTSVLLGFAVEVGRVVGLGWVGEDAEF